MILIYNILLIIKSNKNAFLMMNLVQLNLLLEILNYLMFYKFIYKLIVIFYLYYLYSL